jgi:ATP-dependent helicase HrpB
MKTPQQSLPIDSVLSGLQLALEHSSAVVLQAPPGSGKTTRVPLALYESRWLRDQKILMLEPRRLAATNAARYMASLLEEPVGETVGYTIRYAQKTSPSTRVEVVTEGLLTRRMQRDPELKGVGLVIFDEFHERSLHADLALALCRDIQQGLREDLRILVMSATLDAEPLAKLLGGCPIITAEGRSYPVRVEYLDNDRKARIAESVAQGVRRALSETDGDILAFLPGAGEINRCRNLLSDLASALRICPLYGNLPFVEQEQAILPGKQRRVVLATNVAETSLTIEGIQTVVDSGWEKRLRFDAGRGMGLLETVRISQASAVQRSGRAGRLGPGNCYRLWNEGEQGGLMPFAPPEIRQADLAPLAFELLQWGENNAANLSWLDPPPAGHLKSAHRLLFLLGALDASGRSTRVGREMARFPAHPRMARLLVAAVAEGCPGLGSELVALLSERDLTGGNSGSKASSPSDLLDRLDLLKRDRSERTAAVRRSVRYWQQRTSAGRNESFDADTVGRLLAVAYPDRLARQRQAGSDRYLLYNGQGARMSARSAVRNAEWLVALDVAGRVGEEGEIRMASSLSRSDVEELFGAEVGWQRDVH